jgi:hypothetical protein
MQPAGVPSEKRLGPSPFMFERGAIAMITRQPKHPRLAAFTQDRLGVLGGDNAGFPNGRRPGDDVVDIELRVAMGVLCTLNIGGCKPSDAPAGTLHYTDGAFTWSKFFPAAFPYLQAPIPGSPNEDNQIKRAAR